VRSRVDVIVAVASPASQAARRATRNIPIISQTTGVSSGVSASLGLRWTAYEKSPDLSAKLLSLLREVDPKLSRIAVLVNPENLIGPYSLGEVPKSIQVAARELQVSIVPVEARTPEEIERAFAAISHEHVGAVII